MKLVRHGNIYFHDHNGYRGCQAPAAFLMGATIRLFYSARDAENRCHPFFIDVDANDPSNIVRKTFEPIMPLGAVGHFDDSGVTPSCVVGNHLFYVGWSKGDPARFHQAIGVAAIEGDRFRRIYSGPILERSLHEPISMSVPYVLPFGDSTLIWYTSYTKWEEQNGIMEPFYVIKQLRLNSDELPEFGAHTAKSVVAIPLDGQMEGGLTRATVWLEGDRLRMIFCARSKTDYRRNPEHAYAIKYAESIDGGNTWTRIPCQIDYQPDDVMHAYPFVLATPARRWVFFNNDFASGIHLAEVVD